VDVKMKYFFIIFFVLAFLPFTLACGTDHDEITQTNLAPISSNAVYDGNMMKGYGMGFYPLLVYVLVVISLILFIIWMIKNLKGGKK